jgi:hypothetical protein
MTVFLNFTAGSSTAEVGVYDGPPQYPCPKGRDVLHLLPTDESFTIRVFTGEHTSLTGQQSSESKSPLTVDTLTHGIVNRRPRH